MPKDSRARTRAARARQAASGGTYTQALTATAIPAMNRDAPGSIAVAAALGFGELMAAGARAARATAGERLPAVIAAVREAVIPLWPRTIPEAARDVLVACADLAVTTDESRGVFLAASPTVPGQRPATARIPNG